MCSQIQPDVDGGCGAGLGCLFSSKNNFLKRAHFTFIYAECECAYKSNQMWIVEVMQGVGDSSVPPVIIMLIEYYMATQIIIQVIKCF